MDKGLLPALIVLFSSLTNALVINEVMYDPASLDSNHEWIEFYNNESYDINITGFKLIIDSSEHNINIPPENGGLGDMLVSQGEYFILAQNAGNFSSDYTSFSGTLIDSSWIDMTNSESHQILFKNQSFIFDNITFNANASSGNSVCRSSGGFYACVPSPGDENENISTPTNSSITLEFIFYENITSENIQVIFNVTNYFNESDIDIGSRICKSCSMDEGSYINKSVLFGENETKIFNYSMHLTEIENDTYKIIIAARILGNVFTNTAYLTSFYQPIIEPDFGDCQLIIISHKDRVKFGDSAYAYVKFFTGNYNYSSLRFLAYGYPSQIVSNFSGGSVSANDFNSEAIIEINETGKNQTIYALVPIMIKSNCDNQYSDGSYRIRVRVFRPSWEELETKDLNIFISGKNINLCPEVQKAVCTSSSGGSSSSIINEEIYHEMVDYPKSAEPGDEFSLGIKIVNNQAAEKKVDIYSYVSDGAKPVTLGFNGNVWRGTWSANKKEINLSSKEQAIITLKNILENDTSPGNYTLYVKLVVSEKKYSIKIPFIVTEKSTENENLLVSSNTTTNRTASKNMIFSENQTISITGMTAGIEETNNFFIWILRVFGLV